MKRFGLLFALVLLIISAFGALTARAQSSGQIDIITVKGTVNPVLTDYVKRGIEQTVRDNAQALLIEIDTPGGLDSAMRDINQAILDCPVPVIMYISPSGARAASAGLYITLACHVAAMAPNTVIGAATPVSLSGEIPEDERNKIINDAAAYIRTLASNHNRNADWAERAVREGISATEVEAVNLKIVDLTAVNIRELLQKLDGREVTLSNGTVVTLRTGGVGTTQVPMNFAENFLYTIADPNIAYLLLSLAAIGIFTEITHPGLIFPGVVGVVAGLLAAFALGFLPVNWVGVVFIIAAFGLFIVEVFTPGFGLWTAGGVASLIIGSLILFRGSPVYQVNAWLIGTVAVVFAAAAAFVTWRVVWAHKLKPYVGMENLLGRTGIVKTELNPEGTIGISGELWQAQADSGAPINAGEEVVVTRTEGLKLFVVRKNII